MQNPPEGRRAAIRLQSGNSGAWQPRVAPKSDPKARGFLQRADSCRFRPPPDGFAQPDGEAMCRFQTVPAAARLAARRFLGRHPAFLSIATPKPASWCTSGHIAAHWPHYPRLYGCPAGAAVLLPQRQGREVIPELRANRDSRELLSSDRLWSDSGARSGRVCRSPARRSRRPAVSLPPLLPQPALAGRDRLAAAACLPRRAPAPRSADRILR